MNNEKRAAIERILEKFKELPPEGKDFIAGYILGKEHEREEQEKRRAVEQTA